MIRVRFEEIPYEEVMEKYDGDPDIAARISIDTPLNNTLIKKIKAIRGVGWVEDGVDYTAIFEVTPKEILLLSGCPITWCEHMQWLVSKIIKVLKQEDTVYYEGPPLISNPL